MGRPIFLIGFMCSGKTTLGQALAQRLGVGFIDTDAYIEASEHRTISDIFARDGEAEFRQIETRILDRLLDDYRDRNIVIALGGGTPCRDGVVDKLNRHGVTVHLDTTVERFVERLIEGAAKRPLVKDKTPDQLKTYVAEMLEKRNPFYRQATVTFDSGRLETVEQVEQSVDCLLGILP